MCMLTMWKQWRIYSGEVLLFTCFPTVAIKICQKKYYYLVTGCVGEHEILYQFSF